MTVRSQPLPSTKPSFEPLTPEWSRTAADWLKGQGFGWRFVGAILGVTFLVFGSGMLVFGGYTSIQGIRVPLAFVSRYWGIFIETEGVPTWPWWLIPLLNNFVQIFVKRIPGLQPFWKPSIVFDSLTTAIFLSFGLLTAMLLIIAPAALTSTMLDELMQLNMRVVPALLLASVLSALVGLALTILSEKLFLGSFPLIGALFAPYP